MTLELSNWFWEGVLMKGGVLSIDRAYFDITGGRERWLYKVARKHFGGAGEGGFAISMPTLFDKSGAEGEYRRFKFEIMKLADKNALPGYDLAIEQAGRGGEPLLRMRRNEGKGCGEGRVESLGRPGANRQPGEGSDSCPAPSAQKVSSRKLFAPAPETAAPSSAQTECVDARSLIRSTVAGLSDNATRGVMTDETIDLLRSECPGWDLYALHADFEAWVAGAPERTPANWQKAFIGWVRRHHRQHRHTLRS